MLLVMLMMGGAVYIYSTVKNDVFDGNFTSLKNKIENFKVWHKS